MEQSFLVKTNNYLTCKSCLKFQVFRGFFNISVILGFFLSFTRFFSLSCQIPGFQVYWQPCLKVS